MAFDIKEKIEEVVSKLKEDDGLLEQFKKEPITVIEKLIGVDLPDEQIEKLVDGIKARLKLDSIGDALGGLGKLFGKK